MTFHDRFTRPSAWIDWEHPAIREQAETLARGHTDRASVTEACFVWVRDQVAHTGDHPRESLTRFASEVLEHRTGVCYAKSHLLAALLRANGIPAGLVYQRLTSKAPSGFCLHGLNAVWLDSFGWYRLDARGARADLTSEFTPPREVLPYSPTQDGERLFAGLWAEPVAPVRLALERGRSWSAFAVPDAEDLGPPDLSFG